MLQSRVEELRLELKLEQDTALRVDEVEERAIETLRGTIRLGAEVDYHRFLFLCSGRSFSVPTHYMER